MTRADFTGLVAELRAAGSVTSTAQQVVSFAQRELGADHAGITLLQLGGRLQTIAPSDTVIERLDQLQYDLNEGCCVDSTWQGTTIQCEALVTDPRWPRWGPAAAELGVSSVLAVGLTSTERRRIGALNLYWTQPRSFSKDELGFAEILGRHAALALAVSQRRDDLDVGLDARKRMGIAQGMLMERFRLAPDDAFQVLQRFAEDHGQKLQDLVDELVDGRGMHADERTPAPIDRGATDHPG